MGDKSVTNSYDEGQMREFTRTVLNDLQALEVLLAGGQIEEDVRRIGAEQEMFLVDSSMHPSPIVSEVIGEAKDGRLTTEIGRFNLEANLTPRLFTGSACMRWKRSSMNFWTSFVEQPEVRLKRCSRGHPPDYPTIRLDRSESDAESAIFRNKSGRLGTAR
jgi:hypothetical protein